MQKPVIQCILAAGESRRMGSVKALIKFQNKSLIQHHLERFDGTSIVVLGCHSDQILDSVEINEFVKNDHWKNGQFSSIQKVLNQVPKGFDAFVLPVDHLPIKRSTYSSLIDSRVERFSVIQPSRKGENGHPVLLSEKFIQEILNCDSINNRLDHLIHELPLKYKIQKEIMDPACYKNLNLPSSFGERVSL